MKVIWESSDACIQKEIVTPGDFSRKPTDRSKCRVNIRVISAEESCDGDSLDRVFPTDYLRPPYGEIVVTIGDANSKVDEYLERLIQSMFINEESLARITTTNGKSVSFHFRITLIACERSKPMWELTPKEKYELALSYKEVGVRLHKSVRIVEAFFRFGKACKVLISMEPMEDQEMEDALSNDIENLRKVLYNNMAECHLMRKNYDHAISLCDKVLARDENNVKALYRKAVANENLKDYEKAFECMEKVAALEPRNSAARERLVVYRQKLLESKKNYDNIVKKMFHLNE